MEAYLGQIKVFASDKVPKGWAKCDGQILTIAQNQALWTVLGNNFGGDGFTTFALPDLRGRSIVNYGNGLGLDGVKFAEQVGAEKVTLSVKNIPPHTHGAGLYPNNSPANTSNPSNRVLGNTKAYGQPTGGQSTVKMNAQAITISSSGSGQPFNHRSPYLAVNICIALEGKFPQR